MKTFMMILGAIAMALMFGCSSTNAGRTVAPGALGSQDGCCDGGCCCCCCVTQDGTMQCFTCDENGNCVPCADCTNCDCSDCSAAGNKT